MQIILIGSPVTYIMIGLNNIMRATGYPRKAMLSSMLTVGCNIILAPVFIFWLGWRDVYKRQAGNSEGWTLCPVYPHPWQSILNPYHHGHHIYKPLQSMMPTGIPSPSVSHKQECAKG